MGQRKEATPAQVALAWLLARKPWIVPIPGTTKRHRLDENVEAAAVQLTTHDLREIDREASRIELHGIKAVGSNIDMRPMANGVVIQGGHTTILKPRGYHLLLHGVKAPLVKGSTLPVTLTFEKAGAVTVEFAVEEPGLIGEAILNEEHHRG